MGRRVLVLPDSRWLGQRWALPEIGPASTGWATQAHGLQAESSRADTARATTVFHFIDHQPVLPESLRLPKPFHRALIARAAPLCFWLLGLSVGIAQQVPATKSTPASTGSGAAPASATACAGCHGAGGEGLAVFPRLAGTGAGYLREQLDAFASGARQNPVMQPIAQGLAPEQRAQLASYYAALPAPKAAEDREARRPADRGAWLATRGRWSDELPACAQCHGPGGRGVGPSFPPLAGQPAAYIAQQLRAWQANTRAPGPLELMRVIARKLNDADIQAVSGYYAGLGAAAAGPPAAR